MTNWASRQGFTEFVRDRAKVTLHGSASAKLSKGEEIGCGVVGGARLAWIGSLERSLGFGCGARWRCDLRMQLQCNHHSDAEWNGHMSLLIQNTRQEAHKKQRRDGKALD